MLPMSTLEFHSRVILVPKPLKRKEEVKGLEASPFLFPLFSVLSSQMTVSWSLHTPYPNFVRALGVS